VYKVFNYFLNLTLQSGQNRGLCGILLSPTQPTNTRSIITSHHILLCGSSKTGRHVLAAVEVLPLTSCTWKRYQAVRILHATQNGTGLGTRL